MSTTTTRFLAGAAVAVAVGASGLVLAGPAEAATRNGACESGEFCYYYNSGNAGSVSDFTGSLGDYGASQPECYEFKGAGAGKGVCVKNNAASVWNRSSKTVRVYFNSNYGGSYQDFAAGAKGNLNSTLKNNNASHQVGPNTSRSNMSTALYATSGGRITCGFDGYTTQSGRHEGIDFARGSGSDVHALVSGTVTYVAQGANGGALSTISVYNAASNKTVIYLHSDPRSFVSVGDSISRGQIIADESDRGAGGSPHTHVEMRPGRQTHASVSVGDSHLDNPNPTSFWNSQGYNVR